MGAGVRRRRHPCFVYGGAAVLFVEIKRLQKPDGAVRFSQGVVSFYWLVDPPPSPPPPKFRKFNRAC